MKFFHIADLHFGKSFHKLSLTDSDQPFWIDRFLELTDREKPDAVVISGDIYDRRDPSPEAMTLFSRLLTGLAKRKTAVFAIPGNHDNEVRLSQMSELLEYHNIYIAGPLEKEIQHITLPGAVPVTFWLLPYTFPKYIAGSRVLSDDSLKTAEEAFRALFDAQNIDSGACNVLLAHQNVLCSGKQPEHSESESLIGGLGGIDSSVFDVFDYVALGHIHNAQAVGRETVRYAGCPLYYDFSELNRKKNITAVTVNEKGDIKVESLPIPLPHYPVQYEGSFDELLEKGKAAEKKNVYIQCVVTDKTLPVGAAEMLREVFGDALVNIKRKTSAEEDSLVISGPDAGAAQKSPVELFADYMEEMKIGRPTPAQYSVLEKIAEQQQSSEQGCYDADKVPQTDSEALLNLLESIIYKEADHETA